MLTMKWQNTSRSPAAARASNEEGAGLRGVTTAARPTVDKRLSRIDENNMASTSVPKCQDGLLVQE